MLGPSRHGSYESLWRCSGCRFEVQRIGGTAGDKPRSSKDYRAFGIHESCDEQLIQGVQDA